MDPSGLSLCPHRRVSINFEPEASALQGRRSTAELRAQSVTVHSLDMRNMKNESCHANEFEKK